MKIRIKNGILHDVSLWAKPVPHYVTIDPPALAKDSVMWTHQNVDVTLPEIIIATEERNPEKEYADIILPDGTVIGYVDCEEYTIEEM